jgi:hypothetical protein
MKAMKPMKNETEKPLFIPLKKNHYLAFFLGRKTVEYRHYSPDWNERNCRVGRAVTLSCGYGKKNRMSGIVEEATICHHSDIYHELTDEDLETLGSLRGLFMRIKIGDLEPVPA